MGSNVLDQQLGCLWQKDHLLSISLSGYINYLDKNNPSKPLQVIKVSFILDVLTKTPLVYCEREVQGRPSRRPMSGFLGAGSFGRSLLGNLGH